MAGNDDLLRRAILDPGHIEFSEANDEGATEFNSSFDAHGKYETMRFVLRLSPVNHELVESITDGTLPPSEVSPEALLAYSTYLHETIHWWQHMGSTSGLIFSLSYLAQSHANIESLKNVIEKFGPTKSLKRWTDKVLLSEGEAAQSKLVDANNAVNNALDIEYYKKYAFSPKELIGEISKEQHFESVGHIYRIAYTLVLGLLSETSDPDFLTFPSTQLWREPFDQLRENEIPGYYWGSPIHVPPIGLHAIYEGQARFTQLQFLNGAAGNSLTWHALSEAGYFQGIYVKAFDTFLEFSESERPERFDDPVVGLFLLICDLAINPTRGLPLEVEDFEHFIDDVDVGVRFSNFCFAVKRLPHLRNEIVEHSREEYVRISNELTSEAGYDEPLAALEVIDDWEARVPGLQKLMEEHITFDFKKENLPVRVLFSHFISFSRDKLIRPEFFCWPGVWKCKSKADHEIMPIWLRHLSLFSDRADKRGVYPRNWPDRDPSMVLGTFRAFYGTMALYNLTRQWILIDGPFVYDYKWLMENYSQDNVDAWANDSFQQIYGVNLDDFDIS